jgi:hypothetical protein
VVYGQRITFRGEHREASGPIAVGGVEAETVKGDVAGLRARLLGSGRVEGTAVASQVEEGAKPSGIEADTIG